MNSYRSPLTRAATALFIAALVTSAPIAAWAQADPGVPSILRLAEPAYTLAASCDLSKPLVFVNVRLTNVEKVATPTRTISAVSDALGVLAGEQTVPPMDPGAVTSLTIPMGSVAVAGRSNHALFGPYVVTLSLDARMVGRLTVVIPPPLCGSTGAHGSDVIGVHNPRAGSFVPPTPNPFVAQSITARSRSLGMLSKIAPPANLKSASGGPDCAAHVGAFGALVCPDMIKSGNLLLVWDWQAQSGPDAIDGFRVYHTNGLSRLPTLVTTVQNGKQTLADLAKPPGGYDGRCYAVSAVAGTRESALGNVFCVGSGSVATTTTLSAIHVRTSSQNHRKGDAIEGIAYGTAYSGIVVGFDYRSDKHVLKDSSNNSIYRSAFAFDLSKLLNRRLVAAKLRLKVVPGPGSGASCATEVASGSTYWWESTDWIDMAENFGKVAPTDAAPEITADVTSIATPWFAGRLNFGLVLRNEDENLNAFTNKTCVTTFSDPRLEVTYY